MKTLAITALALGLVVCAGQVHAATIYVDDDNTTGPWDGSQENPYQYIGKAVSVAANNDTIIVMPGTYTGEDPEDPYGTRKNRDIPISDKTITLVSESGPEDTIIDAEDACRVLTLSNAGTTTIEGFTIKDGNAASGAGVSVWNSNPTITNCIFMSNQAWGSGENRGGAIRLDFSDALIGSCRFEENFASNYGGAIYCGDSSAAIEGCILWSNHVPYVSPVGAGGGIYALDSNLTVEGCSITQNEGVGGGIFISGGSDAQSACIRNCTISGNRALSDESNWRLYGGGGITIREVRLDVSILDCRISGNYARENGGAVYVFQGGKQGNITIDSCIIENNRAGEYGGGVYGSGYGTRTVKNCVFRSNRCEDDGTWQHYDGGSICVGSSAETFYIENCLITDSSARQGGGIMCKADSVISNVTLDLNSNTAGGGGFDIRITSGGSVTVRDCILWGHSGVEPEIYVYYGVLTIGYTDIQNGWYADEESGGEVVVDGPILLGQDPCFVAGPLHDYYLSQTAAGQEVNSPCWDAGSDTAVNLGLDELTTRTDNVPDQNTVDIGFHAPFGPEITDVYWDQDDTEVTITFNSEAGEDYVVECTEADEYDDNLGWSALMTVTATSASTTITDDLSTNSLTHDFRFYRINHKDTIVYSRQTAAVFELGLDISLIIKQFFISTPLIPDPDHASVQDVFSTQLDYDNVVLDKLTADAGVYSRMSYDRIADTWSATQGDPFDVVPGEAYWLSVGNAIPIPHTVRLTGYVPEEALTVSVTRFSLAVSRRWMAYSMPRPTTLDDLGLPDAITPIWHPDNEVRLLPLGTNVWETYCWDGVKWYDVDDPEVDAGSTPIACGEGILFIHLGVPGQPDTLTWPTWYLHPPNVW